MKEPRFCKQNIFKYCSKIFKLSHSMKIPGKITILLLMLFNTVMVFADTVTPPPPPPTDKGAVTMAGPVTPPDLPIDSHIFMLVIASLLLGGYIIYNHNLKTKASA